MNKKIKVLHILHSVGGVDIYLRLLTENCNPNIVENVIINGSSDKVYFDKNKSKLKQYLIPLERDISVLLDLKCILKTVKIIKKEKPNIIHAHSAKGGIIARLASLFFKVNVLHTPHAYSYLCTNSKLKRSIFLTIEKLFKNFNSILLATSESELKRGIYEVGYPSNRALLFNNSILPVEKINLETKFFLPQNYICTVGRPSYQKNIEMMVEIIKEVKKEIPNIHMVVMGLGVVSPNTKIIKNLISKYDLESNFTLIEWMEREKILGIISKSNFYLSTSRYEGLPYAIIESLALSKSILATNCDGNRDLVQNGRNGYLIEHNEEKLFVEKIIELHADKALRDEFGKHSLRLFKEKFNLISNIKNLEKIYIDYSKVNLEKIKYN